MCKAVEVAISVIKGVIAGFWRFANVTVMYEHDLMVDDWSFLHMPFKRSVINGSDSQDFIVNPALDT